MSAISVGCIHSAGMLKGLAYLGLEYPHKNSEIHTDLVASEVVHQL